MKVAGKVLIVDDVAMNVALMSALVETIDGLEPIGFEDPVEALRWCEKETPVLVLIDFSMPQMNGAEFVSRLREREDAAIIPVVVVTAHSDRKVLLSALAAGANDFIRKPLDEVEVIARVRNLSQLGHAARQLAALATTDELTGFETRRRFLAHLKTEIGRARRYKHDLSVVMFDVDRFKTINDTAGHSAGDAILSEIAERTLGLVRESDFVGRLGGEEFAWVLPFNNLPDTVRAAERLRRLFEQKPFRDGRTVTASFGVASLEGKENAASLLHRADARLYAAKHGGRNCVRAADAGSADQSIITIVA